MIYWNFEAGLFDTQMCNACNIIYNNSFHSMQESHLVRSELWLIFIALQIIIEEIIFKIYLFAITNVGSTRITFSLLWIPCSDRGYQPGTSIGTDGADVIVL